jgi:hypothetical protein
MTRLFIIAGLLASSTPAVLAQEPTRSGAPHPPPDSPEGLRLFLQEALAVARRGDDQRLAAVVKEMEIPNYEAWFTSTFGPAGSQYAETYGAKLSEQDLARQHMLQATAHWMKRTKTQEVFVRRVNDAPEAGDPYETGVMQNLQRPANIFFAYYNTSALRPNPIGYFVFVEGKYRWLSTYVVEVVTHRILPAKK